ncbi:MAG: ArnT family glycosyltransferase [Thermodesulfobacteriota bacterium]
MFEKDRLNLSFLTLASLFLSIYLFSHTYVISLDGAFQYIPIARDFAKGLYQKGFSNTQQPLYSFLIAFVYRWIPDLEISGRLISSIFGILLVFPVYFLGKWIFNKNIAFLSTLLICIHPYIRRFSADVLKESTYLFFLISSICISWKILQNKNKFSYILVAIFTAISYLVRADGMEVIIALLIFILFIKRFDSLRERTVSIILLISTFFLLLSPYFLFLKELKEEWFWNNAKPLSIFFGLRGEGNEAFLIYKIIISFKKLNFEIFSIFHPLYLFLLMIGLIKRFSSPLKEGEKYILIFIIIHYIVLFLLILNFTDWGINSGERLWMFSGRHVLPLLIFSIYWVGDGVISLSQWVQKKFEQKKPFLSRHGEIVRVMVVVILLAIVLPKTLKTQRYERLTEKWAGFWIKNRFGEGTQIMTTIPRVAYYAGGNLKLIDLKKGELDSFQFDFLNNQNLILVLRNTDVPFLSNKLIKKHFIEINRFENDGMEKIVLYKRIK